MEKILIVVDMQRDFVDGALGSAEAQAIVKPAAEYIRRFDGEVLATYDTHYDDYLNTPEGKKLPVAHCIFGTEGWQSHPEILSALNEHGYDSVQKTTFGYIDMPRLIKEKYGEPKSIELIGICTDICVISNALILKNAFPMAEITVHSALCAGVTQRKHEAALEVMASCQIDIK